MASKYFVSSGDAATDKALQAVKTTLPDLSVFEGARLVEANLTAGTPLRVTHGLRRKYRGFIVVGLSAPAIITDDRTKTDINVFLYLTASVTAAVRLVVF